MGGFGSFCWVRFGGFYLIGWILGLVFGCVCLVGLIWWAGLAFWLLDLVGFI